MVAKGFRRGICVVAVGLTLPLLLLGAAFFVEDKGTFAYLAAQGLLTEYALNSLVIAVATAAGSIAIGIALAFIVTHYRFKGVGLLSFLCVLPLAMPGYVAAMIYGDLLQSAGPVQVFLREMTGLKFGEYYFPRIHSLWGVVFVLTITLYPYIYLMARMAFLHQSQDMRHVAQTLGLSSSAIFRRLTLPMARPAVVAGAALVVMESLADFGVVGLYGIPAFTTGIFRVWQSMFDPVAAARLAMMLFALVLVSLYYERTMRGRARFSHVAVSPRQPVGVNRAWAVGLWLLCLVPFLLGFALPCVVLIGWSVEVNHLFMDRATGQAISNSFYLAAVVTAVAVILGGVFAYGLRMGATRWGRLWIRLATAGYAIPGSVIAVGIMLCFIFLERWVLPQGVLLTGTLLGVAWAITMRLLTIPFQAAETSLGQISREMDYVAASLGRSGWGIFRHIHLPELKTGMFVACILVFIDTVKELPATMLLRPFNFDTLAIRTYELAGDDLLHRAAPSALLLVVLSFLPVYWLNGKMMDKRRQHAA